MDLGPTKHVKIVIPFYICIEILNALSGTISLLTSSWSSCCRANTISLTIISLLIFSFSPSYCICSFCNFHWNASSVLICTVIGKTLCPITLSEKPPSANSHPRMQIMNKMNSCDKTFSFLNYKTNSYISWKKCDDMSITL